MLFVDFEPSLCQAPSRQKWGLNLSERARQQACYGAVCRAQRPPERRKQPGPSPGRPHSCAPLWPRSTLIADSHGQNQVLVDTWLTFSGASFSSIPSTPFSGSSQNQDEQRQLGQLKAKARLQKEGWEDRHRADGFSIFRPHCLSSRRNLRAQVSTEDREGASTLFQESTPLSVFCAGPSSEAPSRLQRRTWPSANSEGAPQKAPRFAARAWLPNCRLLSLLPGEDFSSLPRQL